MLDREVAGETALQIVEHRLVIGVGRDDDVRREHVHAAGDRPDVQIVELAHTGARRDVPADLVDLDIARRGLEQHVECLPQ